MEEKNKKKFKDTKVGQFLLKKLPGIVGDVLPDKGALGIVKNLIDNDPAVSYTHLTLPTKRIV